jgi:hypothetical protein
MNGVEQCVADALRRLGALLGEKTHHPAQIGLRLLRQADLVAHVTMFWRT